MVLNYRILVSLFKIWIGRTKISMLRSKKTDPRLLQPSAVPDEFRILLTPLDYKVLDLWSRGVATRKISKAMKEAGEESMTQKAVENKIAMLKTDPGFADPVVLQRYLEWIEDIVEERQPKSAQQKWEDEDEQMLIKLRVRDGLPTKEIAAKMQRTPKAIERKWSKLRKKYDLAPTVPSKAGARVGGAGGAATDDATLQFEDLLNSVQAVVANTEDPYAAAPAPVYRPPPAPSGASGRKRKREPAVVSDDPTEQLFDPKRVKPEVKYEMDAADDPTRHLTDAAAAINQPAVPILGPLTAMPNQFLIFTQPMAVSQPPQVHHAPTPQPPVSSATAASTDPENLLKWIQQWTEQPSSSMIPAAALPGAQAPQLLPPPLPLPPNMIQTFPSHHM
eukprot:TRINITY_DN3153_c0_g1_i2.p1 TRINITY_DN3153_c0_g1~~TRINITY_DN3153_c0_g1_i2.p1  ORF type:complete len:391 (-),score=80.22 TRINITY_DN3153_c0_g1_i2:104-1276(-)